MKRRNVFLFAVIFSAGIASAVAEEPADESARRETIYFFGSSAVPEGTKIYTPSFVYDTAEDSADDSIVFEFNVSHGTKSVRDDYSSGYKNDGTNKKHEASAAADPPEKSEFSEVETSVPAASRASDGNEMLHVYDFSVLFDSSVTETIGFTGRDGRDDPLYLAELSLMTPDNILLSENGSFSFLSFEKNAFTKDQTGAKILVGDSYRDDTVEETIFEIFSSMFTIPFTLLSLAICGGSILILFTSSGKKANT